MCPCPGRTSSCSAFQIDDLRLMIERHGHGGPFSAQSSIANRQSSIPRRREPMTGPIGRRDFLRTTAAVTAAAMTGAPLFAADTKPKLKKAVKYAMVGVKGTHLEKLELVKKCGFLGVEIDSPGTEKLDE